MGTGGGPTVNFKITKSNIYYMRVMEQDSDGNWSPWSETHTIGSSGGEIEYNGGKLHMVSPVNNFTVRQVPLSSPYYNDQGKLVYDFTPLKDFVDMLHMEASGWEGNPNDSTDPPQHREFHIKPHRGTGNVPQPLDTYYNAPFSLYYDLPGWSTILWSLVTTTSTTTNDGGSSAYIQINCRDHYSSGYISPWCDYVSVLFRPNVIHYGSMPIVSASNP